MPRQRVRERTSPLIIVGRLITLVFALVQVPAPDALHRATLVTRFRNPALPHKTSQVAMDGSSSGRSTWTSP